MKRAAAERSQAGRLPMQYVIVLTKVDKASAKILMNTRNAVMDIYDTLGDINTPPTTSDRNQRTDNDDDDGGSSSAAIDRKTTKKKRRVDSSSSNNITIIETSSTECVGREQLWQIILKVLDDRKKQLLLTSSADME